MEVLIVSHHRRDKTAHPQVDMLGVPSLTNSLNSSQAPKWVASVSLCEDRLGSKEKSTGL